MSEMIELLRNSLKGSIHNRVLLIIAITKGLDKMTVFQREICELLMKNYNITEISQKLNRPRTTIQDEVERIRAILSQEFRWMKELEKLIKD